MPFSLKNLSPIFRYTPYCQSQVLKVIKYHSERKTSEVPIISNDYVLLHELSVAFEV